MSTKVNVNIRLDKELKEKAKKIAESKGTTLSTVLNMYLVDFVDTGKIRYLGSEKDSSVEFEELSKSDEKILTNMPEFNSLMKTFEGM